MHIVSCIIEISDRRVHERREESSSVGREVESGNSKSCFAGSRAEVKALEFQMQSSSGAHAAKSQTPHQPGVFQPICDLSQAVGSRQHSRPHPTQHPGSCVTYRHRTSSSVINQYEDDGCRRKGRYRWDANRWNAATPPRSFTP